MFEEDDLAADGHGLAVAGGLVEEVPEQGLINKVGADQVPAPGLADVDLLQAVGDLVVGLRQHVPTVGVDGGGNAAGVAPAAGEPADGLPLPNELAELATLAHLVGDKKEEGVTDKECCWDRD